MYFCASNMLEAENVFTLGIKLRPLSKRLMCSLLSSKLDKLAVKSEALNIAVLSD